MNMQQTWRKEEIDIRLSVGAPEVIISNNNRMVCRELISTNPRRAEKQLQDLFQIYEASLHSEKKDFLCPVRLLPMDYFERSNATRHLIQDAVPAYVLEITTAQGVRMPLTGMTELEMETLQDYLAEFLTLQETRLALFNKR